MAVWDGGDQSSFAFRFRVEHDAALKDLFTQVLGVLSAEELSTLERVTQDGTRIRAASETDPDARVMKRAGGGFEPAYNVQLTTDAAAGVIVGLQVTQSGADAPQLQPAMEQIQESFGRMPAQVITDSGIPLLPGFSGLLWSWCDYRGDKHYWLGPWVFLASVASLSCASYDLI
jgi:hypothetical protein